MSSSKSIKIINPAMCPHCNKEIIVAHQMTTPIIDWVLKNEDIAAAKDVLKGKILTALEGKDLKDEERDNLKTALDWVNKPETLFGPSEIDALSEQIFGKK